MRRHRLLRNSSAQSLCIFCASRLSGQVAPSTASPRRLLNTSDRSNQQAAAQKAPQESRAQQPSWTFDPSSSLSPSEQREKAYRQQIRREQSELEAAKRKDEEQRQYEQQLSAFKGQEATRTARQKDVEQRRAHNAEERKQTQLAQQKDAEARRQQSQRDRAAAGRQRQPQTGQQVARPTGDTLSGKLTSRRLNMGGMGSANDWPSQNIQDVGSEQDEAVRRRLFEREQIPQRPPSQHRRLQINKVPIEKTEKRVQMPAFGQSAQSTEDAITGWGSGNVDIKPVQHKTDEQIEQEKLDKIESEKQIKRERREEAKRVVEARREEISRSQDQRQQSQRGPFAARASTGTSRSQTHQQNRDMRPGTSSAPPSFRQPYGIHDARGILHRDQSAAIKAPVSPELDLNTENHTVQPKDYSPAPVTVGKSYDEEREYEAMPVRSNEYQQGMRPNSYSPPPREFRAEPARSTPLESPPPQQEERSFHIEGQYRATPFRSADYHPSSAGATEQQWEHTWEHLAPRKKKSRPSPPAPQQPPALARPARQSQAYPIDEHTIDRKFQEHRRQRSFSAQDPFVNPSISDRPAPQPMQRASRPLTRCARCLEEGHSARECMGPIRCTICHQAGHHAGVCPNKRTNGRPQFASREDAPISQADRRRAPENVIRRTSSFDPYASLKSSDAVAESTEPFHYRPTQRSSSQPVLRSERQARPSDKVAAAQTQQKRDEPSRLESSPRPSSGWGLDVEPEDAPEERLSRRRRRGFVEPEDEVEEAPTPKSFERRKEGRGGRRRDQDEDADDEALAAREERSAKKAAKKAQEKADLERRKAARAAGERAGGGTQVQLPEFVSVSNLAQQLGVGYEPFVQRLEKLGYDDIFPGKVLNRETSGMIAMEYDFDPVSEGVASTGSKSEEEKRDLRAAPEIEDTTFLPIRPPVVTIMGHVDHGKTTILDYLRRTSVAAGEAGGITQHIGAFSVPLSSSGRTITFLDTPGHAAFMNMRQRGANVTDIVILVVAADDSVKPQTLESIRCAREAGVPMIVAVNKVDKPEADVQKVKNDLSRHSVEIEDFGGEVQVVEVSGKTGQGLDELEENIVTLSEILDHRSDTEGAVEGWVLEATTKRAGRVATVLVKRGTLRPGAILVAGKTWARVRSLRDERDQNLTEVGPGMPVEVDGWRDQPVAGDEVLQAPGEQKATDVVAYRVERGERLKMQEDMEAINETRRAEQERRRAAEKAAKAAAAAAAGEVQDGGAAETAAAASLEPRNDERSTGGQQTIPFIIKADVSGSAEAVAAYIPSLTSPLIRPDILSSSVGAINESDVELASASKGHIVAFNLPKNEEMRGLAESKGVMVLENNIIYRTLEQVKDVLEKMLPEVKSQRVVGEAEVGQVFEIGAGGRKKLRIAGCKVRNGAVARNSRVRVLRGGEKVYDGTITSLKNVKKDVQDMRKGTECGMGFERWEGFQEGDQIQTYEETSEKRKL